MEETNKLGAAHNNNSKKILMNSEDFVNANNSCHNPALPKNVTKKMRRNKSDMGENFVAPDGGWGWLVAMASGLNTMVTFAASNQFGILFGEHMVDLKISNSQLTTIINTQIAVSGGIGILNGPLFRRLSCRQVSLIGCALSFSGLFACAFANSFLFFILAFSCCYGFGRGLIVSSSIVGVNTFFAKKRCSATALGFGVDGLGSIVFPYLATYLMSSIGRRYTMFCFAAISLNAVVGSLLFQPVKWHKRKESNDIGNLPKLHKDESTVLKASRYENKSDQLNSESLEENNTNNTNLHLMPATRNITNDDMIYMNEYREIIYLDKCIDKMQEEVEEKNKDKRNKSFSTSIVSFLDLDLLRDLSFLNLVMGLTLANFVEVNFVVLTPFVLSDFGYALPEIALAMSLMGFSDLILRFLIPLIAIKLKLSNKVFFTFGSLGMCLGRFLLPFTKDVYVMFAIFLWMGFSKAFRTIFWSLIIPEYIPLNRLPAASGLQRVMAGTFSLACGPLIGLIRDNSSNYAVTLNCLNALCLLALSMWSLEYVALRLCKKDAASSNELR
ncbi:monocarboxylate transporter 6-like [Haematobia irritans]|uniref:monocarboxylate transporter 6-like n=1 Tax=Haematobia irritans TaxID=7368 RepID=UPI003F50A476